MRFAAVQKVSSLDVWCALDKIISLLLCQNCFSKNIEELLAPKADSFSEVIQFGPCASETMFTSSGLSEVVLPQQLISKELPNICSVEDLSAPPLSHKQLCEWYLWDGEWAVRDCSSWCGLSAFGASCYLQSSLSQDLSTATGLGCLLQCG